MNRIHRRQFLRTAVLTGSGLGVAPAWLRAASPNEKLGVVVIGVGGRGGSHLDAFAGDLRTEIRYIVDVDE